MPRRSLASLAAKLARVGAAEVEAIPATQELIAAGTHAASSTCVLWHLKLLPSRSVLVTVRSANPAVSQEALDKSVAVVPGP